MLIPGTATWVDAALPALVALLLLLVPGLVALWLLGCRSLLALALAAPVSTAVVVAGGSVSAPLGVPWGPVPLAASAGATWLLALVLRLVLRRVGRAGAVAQTPGGTGDADRAGDGGDRGDAGDAPATPPSDAVPVRGWLLALATGGGVLLAAAVVARVLTASASTPELFPQHPDTIFHLGVTQWMATERDVSFQHGTTFSDRPLNVAYPVGFHAVAATVSLLSGVSAVVAISALVVVVAGLVWPLGMAVLARTALAPSASAGPVAAVLSVVFIPFPFMLMGFGVLWPNLFGQAMVAGVLAAAVALTDVIGGRERSPRATWTLAVATLAAVPGLALGHQSAVIVLVLLAGLALWFATLRRGLAQARGTRWRWAPVLTVTAAIAAATVASLYLSPTSMIEVGEPGAEMTHAEAWTDVLGFAPRIAEPVPLLGYLVIAGVLAVCVWRRRALWAVVATVSFAALYFQTVAIDDATLRHLSWPWYNNAIRIAAVGVLPAVVVATALFAGLGRAVAVRTRRPWLDLLAAGVLLGLVVVPPAAWKDRDVDWLRPYFRPGEARSWASPGELRALRELSTHIPADAVTAADPWRGGSYLYVVSGRKMYFPTEKTNTTPETRLVGFSLDEVGTDPEVCRVATENRIEYAITGGLPFLWGAGRSREFYAGVNDVGSSPAWEQVAAAEPYTLYRRVACAS
ncbi:DUF6541 family protein [Oryzobacter sp. R7]|uniref:DUF6541 family protein n=1 Tax=Oryzobacter faecalis TaxID=3388656 RepID=UPI00398D0848